MRGILITLLTGVIAGQVLSAYSEKRFGRGSRIEDRIGDILADVLPASSVSPSASQGARRTL